MTIRRDESNEDDGGGAVDDFVDEIEDDDEDEAIAPTVSVDLPAPVRSAPADELAVAIHDEVVSPGAVTFSESSVLSIDVNAVELGDDFEGSDLSDDDVVRGEVVGADSESVEELQSRRDRLRGAVSTMPESASMLTSERLIDVGRRRRPRRRVPGRPSSMPSPCI